MTLVRLVTTGPLDSPVVVAAMDGWVDSGSAATTAASLLAEEGDVLATFDSDRIYDYRARRPTLEIINGMPMELTWPELRLVRRRLGDRDILVLTGPEPDFRWQQLGDELAHLARMLEIQEWISLGAIPAAVPHTRPVTVFGTASRDGLLRAEVEAGPIGTMTVPAAAISILDLALSGAGVPAVGYFAQVPHYISGEYPAAALQLLAILEQHLGITIPRGSLDEEARQLRTRLDAAAAADPQTHAYVERLEGMVDEARLPSGTELISDIERFLRDRGAGTDARG
jgi:proteasome assembly chaperone (PAC2) family protein